MSELTEAELRQMVITPFEEIAQPKTLEERVEEARLRAVRYRTNTLLQEWLRLRRQLL